MAQAIADAGLGARCRAGEGLFETPPRRGARGPRVLVGHGRLRVPVMTKALAGLGARQARRRARADDGSRDRRERGLATVARTKAIDLGRVARVRGKVQGECVDLAVPNSDGLFGEVEVDETRVGRSLKREALHDCPRRGVNLHDRILLGASDEEPPVARSRELAVKLIRRRLKRAAFQIDRGESAGAEEVCVEDISRSVTDECDVERLVPDRSWQQRLGGGGPGAQARVVVSTRSISTPKL